VGTGGFEGAGWSQRVTYDVQFSLEAAAELVRIAGEIGSAAFALQAADRIRRKLENDAANQGEFLSEGLYFLDDDPLRAFFLIDTESMVVEVTDFRIL
jgi:hypothetical protein